MAELFEMLRDFKIQKQLNYGWTFPNVFPSGVQKKYTPHFLARITIFIKKNREREQVKNKISYFFTS